MTSTALNRATHLALGQVEGPFRTLGGDIVQSLMISRRAIVASGTESETPPGVDMCPRPHVGGFFMPSPRDLPALPPRRPTPNDPPGKRHPVPPGRTGRS